MTTFKTGNPVPSSAAKDLYDNAENLDDAVNGSADRWVDRTGRLRMSVSGAVNAMEETIETAKNDADLVLESLGYLVPVPYAQGITVDSARFTVSYNGDTFAANADSIPFVTGATFDPSLWRTVQGVTAVVLGSASGSTLVGYSAPSSGGVLVDVGAMLGEAVTVDNYRRPGDFDDGPSFRRMHDALGYIRLKKKTYRVSPKLELVSDRIVITGAGKPVPNSGNTALVDGSGSIIVGTVFLRASVFILRDFGADVGDSRGFPDLQEGIVFDALVNGVGIRADVSGIASMGPTGSVSSHGMLNEGFDSGDLSDIDIYNHNYGLVVKSRNFKIRGVRGTNVKVATVYLKSSLPNVGGDVQSALVNNIEVSGVISITNASGLPIAPGVGVWVHAEGVPATNVKISQVYHQGGRAGVRVTADGAQYVAQVQMSDISTEVTILGWELVGTVYECQGSGFSIVNPSSAQAWQSDAATRNWRFSEISLVVTQPGITGTSVATMGGGGTWDNLTVRNASVPNMQIGYNWSNVRGGRKSGNVLHFGEGALTLQNGAVAAAGEVVPRVDVRDDNTIALTGAANLRGSSSPAIALVGGSVNFGVNRYFQLTGRSGSAFRSVPVIVSGPTLTVLDSSYTNLDVLDLSGIIVHR